MLLLKKAEFYGKGSCCVITRFIRSLIWTHFQFFYVFYSDLFSNKIKDSVSVKDKIKNFSEKDSELEQIMINCR